MLKCNFFKTMFSYCILRHFKLNNKLIVRFKHAPDHWSVLRKKIHPIDKALEHFDDFYKQVFNKRWETIRAGLLGKQKYVAVVNNYADSEETIKKFELNGALNVRQLFEIEKRNLGEKGGKTWKMKPPKRVLAAEEVSKEEESTKPLEIKASDLSLEHSLKHADYDKDRIVDEENALSAEILKEFIPATKLKGREDFVLESDHYKMYDSSSNFQIPIEKEYDLHFPANLNIYCFEKDNLSDFPPSKRGSTGVLNYYLMDGGSILPVLALDLRPGCRLLDLCAGPGGKSLLAIQTLYPDQVLSNDVSHSRVERINSVYRQFLYDFNENWINEGKIIVTQQDGRYLSETNFDRILVDVPCTTDRHSLQENDNNIFKPSRVKERLKLPELQSQLLVNALKIIDVDGIVVYSTCSLSPIQNDGVVHMALKQIWEEKKFKFVVKDLSPALKQTRSVFEFAHAKILRFGHLVVPDEGQNYGPTYFCKLQRIN